MKTMYPLGYHHNGFVATDALGHIIYGCGQVHELPQSHCDDKRESTFLSIYLFIHLYKIIYNIYNIYIYIYICHFFGKMKAIVVVGVCGVIMIWIIATYILCSIYQLRVGSDGVWVGYVVRFGFAVNTP